MKRLAKGLGALLLAGAMALPAAAQEPESPIREPAKPYRSVELTAAKYYFQDIRTSSTDADDWDASAVGYMVQVGTQIASDGSDKYGSLSFEAQLGKVKETVGEKFEEQGWEPMGDGRYTYPCGFYGPEDRKVASRLEGGLQLGRRVGVAYRSPRLGQDVNLFLTAGFFLNRASFGERRQIERYITWDEDHGDFKAGETEILMQDYDRWDVRPPKWSGTEKTVMMGIQIGNRGLISGLRLSRTFGMDERFRLYNNIADAMFYMGYSR